MTQKLALVAAVLLGVGVGACGGAAKHAGAPSKAAARAGSSDSARPGMLGFGQPASASDGRAITALVQHYYAAAAAEDGTKACGLTYYILAESIPEQYGHPPGPLYLRGLGTCQAVLSAVFRRFHAQLAQPPQVAGVRAKGKHTYALLRWAKLPPGFIEVRREGRAWKIDQVLAAPLQ
jgi:hypothetical protein